MAAINNYSYNRFKQAFLAKELEAYFEYGDYQIRLIDAPKISYDAACAVVLKPNRSLGLIRSLFERMMNRDFVTESIFSTREELLANFRFQGKTIEEMWPELIPCFEL